MNGSKLSTAYWKNELSLFEQSEKAEEWQNGVPSCSKKVVPAILHSRHCDHTYIYISYKQVFSMYRIIKFDSKSTHEVNE